MIEPSEGNRPLPLFETARLINLYSKGNILGADVVSASKPADEDDKVISTLAPVGVHFSSYKGKYALVLSSRDFSNDFQVQLKLPAGVTLNSTAKKYIVSGSDFNTKFPLVDSATTALPLVDNMIVTVPKNSMVMLVFGGTDLNQKLLPLGYSAYKRIQSLSIVPKTVNTDIDVPFGGSEFIVEYTPKDALNKNIVWTFNNKDSVNVYHNVEYSVNSITGVFVLSANGECDGNGNVIIKVSSVLDTNVFAIQPVKISNQITDGLESCPITNVKLPSQIVVNVSPNPSSSVFTINYEGPNLINYKVTNSMGTVMIRGKKVNSNSIKIDLSSFQTGIYILDVESNGLIKRLKLLKY